MNPNVPDPVHEEPPPLLGTWPRLYTGVVLYLIAIIAVFYFFSRAWAR